MEVAIEGVGGAFCDEDAIKAGVGSALVPVKKWAVFGMVVGPEVALLGFTSAGLKVADGCFIDLEIVAGTKLKGEEMVEGLKSPCEVVVPGAHEVAGEFDAVGGSQSPFLPIEGLVIAELFGEEVSAKRWGEDTAGKEAGF